jgi:hypothetical protein
MTQAKVFGRWTKALWLASSLLVLGCPKKEEPASPPEPTGKEAVPAPTPQADPPAPTGGAQPSGTPEAPAAEPSTPPPSDTPAPTPPPAPDTGAVAPEDPKNREWTAGSVKLTRSSLKPVTLRSVREGRNEGFDRVVFEFDGPQVPGYSIQYVDKPVVKCGSGDPTEVAGQGWLQVSLTPAQAHADGQSTITSRERKAALSVLQELELTCDFEAEVTWVLGAARPNKYRVMELREPTRLVVDVQH